jgi:hypothetical protein
MLNTAIAIEQGTMKWRYKKIPLGCSFVQPDMAAGLCQYLCLPGRRSSGALALLFHRGVR